MKTEKIVLDTSVIAEYLDEESPYSAEIEELFQRIFEGKTEAYLPLTTVSESIYVAAKIYEEAGIENPNEEALRLVKWLLSSPNIKLAKPTLEISIHAGELKKEIRIALTDCYVIATAKALKATPLFLKLEKEMEPHKEKLEKHGVKYLIEEQPNQEK